VRAKTTDEGPALPEIHRTTDAISEFDDDEEVQEPRVVEPRRRKVPNAETNIVDPTASPQHLRTMDVNSQVFLSSKHARGEQLRFTPHVVGGIFGQLEQKRLQQDEPDIDSDPQGLWVEGDLEGNIGGSPWSPGFESPHLDAAIIERRWKGKDRVVGECSRPDTRLSKSSVLKNPTADAPRGDANKSKDTSATDLIVLSDEDDPVPDPEDDKFNLANQIPREELQQALDAENITDDALERT
jgi:hypothetical protein